MTISSSRLTPSEVVARVRARIRKTRLPETQGNTADFAGWTAHFNRYALTHSDGRDVSFSHAEGEVLRLFLERPKAADFSRHDAGNSWWCGRRQF